jgi:hypothetical protein
MSKLSLKIMAYDARAARIKARFLAAPPSYQR